MTFNEFSNIIKQIKKSTKCNKCSKKYLNQDIEILTSLHDQAILHLSCPKCKTQTFVHTNIIDSDNANNAFEIKNSTSISGEITEQEFNSIRDLNLNRLTGHGKISTNDVIDLHNFLNNFNGDFKQLFTKQNNAN